MATKTYDSNAALDPNKKVMDPETGDIDYSAFVDSLPQEFQAEIEEALVALLTYIHSDEGTSTILEAVQSAKGKEAQAIGIEALKAMDAADPEHKWSDSAKVFAGYFAVKEVATLAREAGIIDVPAEREGEIFKVAAQNYIHAIIKSKPTREEREAEAIRIQKEVEPLLSENARMAGRDVARKEGIQTGDDEQQMEQGRGQGQPQRTGGLLE